MNDYPYHFCQSCGSDRPEAFEDDRDTLCVGCLEQLIEIKEEEALREEGVDVEATDAQG